MNPIFFVFLGFFFSGFAASLFLFCTPCAPCAVCSNEENSAFTLPRQFEMPAVFIEGSLSKQNNKQDELLKFALMSKGIDTNIISQPPGAGCNSSIILQHFDHVYAFRIIYFVEDSNIVLGGSGGCNLMACLDKKNLVFWLDHDFYLSAVGVFAANIPIPDSYSRFLADGILRDFGRINKH